MLHQCFSWTKHRHSQGRTQAVTWRRGLQSSRKNDQKARQTESHACNKREQSMYIEKVICTPMHVTIAVFHSIASSRKMSNLRPDPRPPTTASRPVLTHAPKTHQNPTQHTTHAHAHARCPHYYSLTSPRLLPRPWDPTLAILSLPPPRKAALEKRLHATSGRPSAPSSCCRSLARSSQPASFPSPFSLFWPFLPRR